MKNASVTIKFLYSSFLLLSLGCSSAVPTAPVTKTQQTPAVSSDANKTADAASEAGKETAGTAPAAKAEDKAATPPAAPAAPAPLALTSTAFANMGAIPLTYVARNGGSNQSPPLQWKNAPAGTGSFAIQMIDLDFANPQPLVHWMISNIPATSTQLPAAVPRGNNLAAPAEALGANQFKDYGGPSPPSLHRYEWTIYAIKQGETLNLTDNSTTNKAELESKSLGKATLIGTFAP